MAHQLYQKGKFTDAVIKCSGQEFNVHRAVLASTSEVFDRMFSSSMREGAEAVVLIEDATPEAVEALIEGMYCGKLPEKRLLPSFWHLASKYLIEDLAAAAMRVMYEEIDISIATDFLLALRHHTQNEDAGSGSEMWSGLLQKLESDKAMHRRVLEELADGSCKRLKRS
ncbi:unnamed protein product [Prorocentrum cordatum]|uniref:BTB domain-containing protein n=1 Tax=Prorocentrum cordatum TaxID=2364126 RepID=A0ABN9R7C4_9DINO|nr:unnamed protein product [Polarella glacialis]